MNVLDLIYSNNNWKEQERRIIHFENKNNIILPPIYKSFIVNFNSDHILDDKLLCYFNEEISTTLQLYESEYLTDQRVSLYEFWKIEDILHNMKKIYSKEDYEELEIDKYIGLGECAFHGIILLGVSEDNYDQIFIEYPHEKTRITKIEDNILDFFRNYKISLSMNTIEPEAIKEKIYKRWGEKFWRIYRP